MSDKNEKSSTEKQLVAALERLIAQKPTNVLLKQKLRDKKLKIVVSNVEKEAGLSNGAAKHYPKIKEQIENAEMVRLNGASDVPNTVILGQPIYIKAKEDLAKAKEEIKRLKADLVEKNNKLDAYKILLKEQAAISHQISKALWDQIPEDKKHIELMRHIQQISNPQNVVVFKRQEQD